MLLNDFLKPACIKTGGKTTGRRAYHLLGDERNPFGGKIIHKYFKNQIFLTNVFFFFAQLTLVKLLKVPNQLSNTANKIYRN